MSTEPADAGLQRVNNRSKAVAVLGTLVALGVGFQAIGEIQFVSIAAIGIGIGIRFGSLWIGTRYLETTESSMLTEQPTAGGYHHGAIGFALIIAGTVALVTRSLDGDVLIAASGSVGIAVITYLVLSALLPE